MAVITRFIVVRSGVELDKIFDVKKEADAYDKMLDAAENLAVFIKKSDLQIDLDAKTVEEISICLAKNAPEVTNILRGIKPITPSAPTVAKVEKAADPAPVEDKKSTDKKTKSKRREK
jgi:dsDNA-binding SOS-regulon protein